MHYAAVSYAHYEGMTVTGPPRAFAHGLTLATVNTSEFKRVPALELLAIKSRQTDG
jgi:hypothetical protein